MQQRLQKGMKMGWLKDVFQTTCFRNRRNEVENIVILSFLIWRMHIWQWLVISFYWSFRLWCQILCSDQRRKKYNPHNQLEPEEKLCRDPTKL